MAKIITPGLAALQASDLCINIYPRDYTSYRGTSAQLIAEGLIPEGFKWPEGSRTVRVEAGKYLLWIRRTHPNGRKGPMSSWITGDYWWLHRSLLSGERSGFNEAAVYEKTQELLKAIHKNSPEWHSTWSKVNLALKDQKYTEFRALLLGELAPRKRGRRTDTRCQHEAINAAEVLSEQASEAMGPASSANVVGRAGNAE